MKWLLLALATIPAWIYLGVVIRYGVNCPIADEWNPDIGGLFVKWHDGTLRPADFWPLDNEHRIVIPRIVILLLGWLTRFDSRGEMIFTWGCCWATSLMLLWLIRRDGGTLTYAAIGKWFACNALVFNVTQIENVITGLGLINVLPTTIIIFQLVLLLTRLSPRMKYWLAMLLAIIATYTFGNGVLAWACGSIFIAWSDSPREVKKRIPALALWYGVGLVCIVLYMIGYQKPGLSPPLAGPLQTIRYAVIFSGNLLTYTIGGAPWSVFQATAAGAVFLLLFAFCFAYFIRAFLRHEEALCNRMLVWVAIAAYALLSTMIASVLRAGNPPNQATASRYVSYSIYLPIAIFNLLPMVCADIVQRWRATGQGWGLKTLRWVPTAFMLITVIFVGTAIRRALWHYFFMYTERRMAKAALLLDPILPDNPMITRVLYPWPEKLLPMTLAVNDLGLIKPPLIKNPDISTLIDPGLLGTTYGALEEFQQIEGNFVFRGWAIDPVEAEPADGVVLTCDDPAGRPYILAMGEMGVANNGRGRDEIVARFNNDLYLFSGWVVSFRLDGALPPGMTQLKISAWAIDITTGRFHKLDRDMTLRLQ